VSQNTRRGSGGAPDSMRFWPLFVTFCSECGWIRSGLLKGRTRGSRTLRTRTVGDKPTGAVDKCQVRKGMFFACLPKLSPAGYNLVDSARRASNHPRVSRQGQVGWQRPAFDRPEAARVPCPGPAGAGRATVFSTRRPSRQRGRTQHQHLLAEHQLDCEHQAVPISGQPVSGGLDNSGVPR
jgi:hypothetical protein